METGLDDEQYRRVLFVLTEGKGFERLQTPEELHQLAWNWNWDNGRKVLRKIIQHPLCDHGTALLVYWYAAPRWYYQFATRGDVAQKAKWGLPDYDLLKDIEKRYLKGSYRQATIAFDPTNDRRGGDLTKAYQDEEAKQTIPDLMMQPSPGRILDRARF